MEEAAGTTVVASVAGAAEVAGEVVLQAASVALEADPSAEAGQEEAGDISSYCFR